MEHNENDLTFGTGQGATNVNTTQANLSHEQLARDEQFVGALIATVTAFCNREKYEVTPEKYAFTEYYKDTELYESQRNFVKKVLEHPTHRDFVEYVMLLLSNGESNKQSPLDTLFNSFNKGDKAFLIRQIFRHTNQVLEKYRFLQDYVDVPEEQIDLDNLSRALWTFPIEQKILCMSYIFSKIKDGNDEGRETLAESIKKLGAIKEENAIATEEERAVHKFFCAFYIQHLLQKDYSNISIMKIKFLEPFYNDELYATQRIFIKNLIGNPQFKNLGEEMKSLFIEYNETQYTSPCNIFLGRLNKEALLKQVFINTDTSPKYKFLPLFLSLADNNIDLDSLNGKIWHLSQEQQIFIFAYIFSKLHDPTSKKKKTIHDSFKENCERVKIFLDKTGTGTQTELENVDFMLETVKKYR